MLDVQDHGQPNLASPLPHKTLYHNASKRYGECTLRVGMFSFYLWLTKDIVLLPEFLIISYLTMYAPISVV